MEINNFQRVGSASNARVGSEFEKIAADFFAQQEVFLQAHFPAPVGVGSLKKNHKFDLGSADPPVLVECKSHKWTQGGNVPSAKLTVWNEAMYYFHIAPAHFRKILFVLKHSRRDVSLASHYVANYRHLIPDGVELWECCTSELRGIRIL